MLNIISRSIIFKNISGPQKVVANLIKGLDKLGYPYVVNKRLDYCQRLYIHDDTIALTKISQLDPSIKVLVGPNLYVVPRDLPKNLDISRAVYLTPSPWNKGFWQHFGFDKCPIDVWPTGIDTDEFKPSSDRKQFILVYFKQRFDEELEKVKKNLEIKSLQYKVIHYDKGYKEDEFKKLLKGTRYAIWIGRHESQGIALQETLACDVPILVCDISSVGHCIGGVELNQEEKDFTNTTSASYFDTRCGIKIKDLNQIDRAISDMEENLKIFKPREYIVENLGLEKQARELLGFYEKYFNLSYQEGFNEKPIRSGNWINARWYYVIYLKIKHYFKIFLIKIGVWKLIKG